MPLQLSVYLRMGKAGRVNASPIIFLPKKGRGGDGKFPPIIFLSKRGQGWEGKCPSNNLST